MDITIKIPDKKVPELRLGFLAAVQREKEDEELTDIEFFKKWIMNQIKNIYKTGKIIIAREATEPEIDEDLIESVE